MLNSENVLYRSGEMAKCKNNFPYVCEILSSKPQDLHKTRQMYPPAHTYTSIYMHTDMSYRNINDIYILHKIQK